MAFMADELAQLYSSGLPEATRLTRTPHGRLEFLRIQELLRRTLPSPPARVLDVGGGTGVHAAWLAIDGYEVRLIDPVVAHVEAAAALDGVEAELGDARRLDCADSSVDAVVMLGPMYHLIHTTDRAQALAECRRVLRPGGVIAVAGISRYLSLLESGAAGTLSAELAAAVTAVIDDGIYDGHVGFTPSQWHTAEQLGDELRDASFRDVVVYGVEGPAWPALDAAGMAKFARLRDAALRAARIVEQDPFMINTSAHLVAVAVA